MESVQKTIKTLLNICLFDFKLKQKSNYPKNISKEKTELECYLINEKLINIFKEFYFDEVTIKFVNKEIAELIDNEDDNYIINELFIKIEESKEIINKINEKEKNLDQ